MWFSFSTYLHLSSNCHLSPIQIWLWRWIGGQALRLCVAPECTVLVGKDAMWYIWSNWRILCCHFPFQIFVILWVWISYLAIASCFSRLVDLLCLAMPFPFLRFCVFMRAVVQLDFKNVSRYDRMYKKNGIAELNIIFLYQDNVNAKIFSHFLSEIADEKQKGV